MAHDSRPVLVLGATGTTGRRLVHELAQRGSIVRAASRHPGQSGTAGVTPVAFDWEDPVGHDAVLHGVGAVYLMAPPADPDPARRVVPFVERAVAAGVARLVLLSASAVHVGDPGPGELPGVVAGAGVGWAVLRPSWFMQNLWNPGHPIGAAVRAGGEIVTATGEGRVGFIDAGDIAGVAARALADAVAPNRDLILTGPQALSYDEVAELLTDALGRPVTHRSVSAAEAVAGMTAAGMGPAFAEILAGLDTAIAAGAEDRVTDTVARVTGSAPRALADVLATDHPFEKERA